MSERFLALVSGSFAAAATTAVDVSAAVHAGRTGGGAAAMLRPEEPPLVLVALADPPDPGAVPFLGRPPRTTTGRAPQPPAADESGVAPADAASPPLLSCESRDDEYGGVCSLPASAAAAAAEPILRTRTRKGVDVAVEVADAGEAATDEVGVGRSAKAS